MSQIRPQITMHFILQLGLLAKSIWRTNKMHVGQESSADHWNVDSQMNKSSLRLHHTPEDQKLPSFDECQQRELRFLRKAELISRFTDKEYLCTKFETLTLIYEIINATKK